MARLAIARGFLGEYAKLDKDVQIAVDAAISTFARHPQPGQHLEKPRNTRDTRIRLLPVDDRWRGIVLAPVRPQPNKTDKNKTSQEKTSPDTYCLVTVLPQDQADAYATSHRFSVNRVLGVLEVRDEEAIENLQPAAAEDTPEDRKLFDDVTDAGLARLGVDPQLLPTVRRLTGEDELEALEGALPAAQYAALYALAAGMSVDEALAEVVRLVPGGAPKATFDPDDLVSAMERAPGQVTFVSGPEELRHILAHPFAAWRTFLHPSQREIAYLTSYAGPAPARRSRSCTAPPSSPSGPSGPNSPAPSSSPPSTATWPTSWPPSSTCSSPTPRCGARSRSSTWTGWPTAWSRRPAARPSSRTSACSATAGPRPRRNKA